MGQAYEAKITGDAGTFIAVQIERELLVIYEVIDECLNEVSNEAAELPDPNSLYQTLATWIYEHRRGYMSPVPTNVDT